MRALFYLFGLASFIQLSLANDIPSLTQRLKWAGKISGEAYIEHSSHDYKGIKSELKKLNPDEAIFAHAKWSFSSDSKEFDDWLSLIKSNSVQYVEWEAAFEGLSFIDKLEVYAAQGASAVISTGRLRDAIRLRPLAFLSHKFQLREEEWRQVVECIATSSLKTVVWDPTEHRHIYSDEILKLSIQAIAVGLESIEEAEVIRGVINEGDFKGLFKESSNTFDMSSRIEPVDLVTKELYRRFLSAQLRLPDFEETLTLSESSFTEFVSQSLGRLNSGHDDKVELVSGATRSAFVGLCSARSSRVVGSYIQSSTIYRSSIVTVSKIDIAANASQAEWKCGQRSYGLNFVKSATQGRLNLPNQMLFNTSPLRAFVSLALIPEIEQSHLMALYAVMLTQGYKLSAKSFIQDIEAEFTEEFEQADVYIPITNEPRSSRFRTGFHGGVRLEFIKNINKLGKVSRIHLTIFLPPVVQAENKHTEALAIGSKEIQTLFRNRGISMKSDLLVLSLWCDSSGSIPVWLDYFASGVINGSIDPEQVNPPLIVGSERGFNGENLLSLIEVFSYPLQLIEDVSLNQDLESIVQGLNNLSRVGKFYKFLGLQPAYESFEPVGSWEARFNDYYDLASKFEVEIIGMD